MRDQVLPEQAIIKWRPTAGESFPTPDTDEVIVFEHYFYRGFGLPTCTFFRGLLSWYEIELVHLKPNITPSSK